jgi:lipid-A-disaccharide synthase
MRYYIIAGEASGDLHGSNLMKGILKNDPEAEFRIFGGDGMASNPNTTVVKHINEMSFMGFVEVLKNLSTINKNMKECKLDLQTYMPDVLILIDFPGFNLRIAKFAKSIGIKTAYYISPKVWAWNKKRVFEIKKYIDKLYTILPFETDFFKQYDYEVEYVGNPLKDAISTYTFDKNFKQNNNLSNKPILAILPGSRKMELDKILPSMLAAAKNFISDYQIVIAGASNLPSAYYTNFDIGNNKIIFAKTYDILANAEMAMVTSGTATLETALFKVPQVVCYRANGISVFIARMLVDIKFISLVNLIMDDKIVAELIQEECTPENITSELNAIKINSEGRERMLKKYDELLERVGEAGASERAAKSIVEFIKLN